MIETETEEMIESTEEIVHLEEMIEKESIIETHQEETTETEITTERNQEENPAELWKNRQKDLQGRLRLLALANPLHLPQKL